MHSRSKSEDIKKLVKGLMIESYLEDGNQPTDGNVYGKSITDPCLGWENTCLSRMHSRVRIPYASPLLK